jgi:RHS repeat-associated protein
LNQEGPWAKGGVAGNKYQYNGKELNEDFGLDLEDYGGRWYNPALGRWVEVDPMGETGGQESWTGYHYVFGNPISRTDPDGRVPSGDAPSSSTMDKIHLALDVAGFVPGYGEIADAVNTVVYAFEGNFKDVGISLVAVIPIVGDVEKAAKYANNTSDAVKAVDKINDAAKVESRVAKSTDIVTSSGRKVDLKTGQPIGPSGKPMVHTVSKSSKKEA